nr:hypothetical protein [Tanacetum cinerariifolium]
MSDARDCMQKAKIQWAVEGDENSKFLHGVINRKRANLSIKGVMVDSEWVDDLTRVKEEFRLHFANRFNTSGVNRSKLSFSFPNQLSLDQAAELESPISNDEIRKAVWGVFFEHCSFTRGCNSSFVSLIPKVHDPKFVTDYRPISLIGSLYKVVTKILASRLSVVISDLISDVQNAFVILLCILLIGIGIKGSLTSGMASILVNGSPTSEFQFHCGLKQGDPLAPYPFILIMESLHLSFSRVVDAGIFKGIKIDNAVTISQLFYVDDVVFVGEWSDDNLNRTMHVLYCFSLASGLNINVKKSYLLGVVFRMQSRLLQL